MKLSLAWGALAWSATAWTLQVPGPLVGTARLAENLSDVALLDLRQDTGSFTQAPPPAVVVKGKKAELRVKGHIPGAKTIRATS